VDPLVLVLRLVHVVAGVLWVGSMFFATTFLTPALQEAGPDGAKVMAGLQRRGMMTVIPIIALATIFSGLWLYWRVSNGFDPAWSRSGVGLALGLGGVAAIIAFAIGFTTVRPSMVRAGMLAQQLAQAPQGGDREAILAEVGRLRARAAAAGRVVMSLLLFAAATMAVARYL
jgi:uncharacterized membrane protein